MIYDDGSTALVFKFGDKIRSAPIILSYNNQKIIIVGSKDGKLYAIVENGDLSFEFDSVVQYILHLQYWNLMEILKYFLVMMIMKYLHLE